MQCIDQRVSKSHPADAYFISGQKTEQTQNNLISERLHTPELKCLSAEMAECLDYECMGVGGRKAKE